MKAIITRGFPASGKSTFAQAWVAEDPESRVEVNRDNIREMLAPGSSHRAPENSLETFVSNIHNAMIRSAAELGKDLVVSDMNLNRKFAKQLLVTLVGLGYEVEFKDFIVPIDELVAREKKRAKLENGVIERLYKRYPYDKWYDADKLLAEVLSETIFAPLENNPNNQRTVVFDIDGTLARMVGRSPYDLARVSEDVPNANIVAMTHLFHEKGYKVVIFSGRDSRCKPETVKWLQDHNVYYDDLRMRTAKDQRNDSIVKYEMVRELVKDHYIETVFDDRDRVVSMWRQSFPGQPTICAQVNYGDF